MKKVMVLAWGVVVSVLGMENLPINPYNMTVESFRQFVYARGDLTTIIPATADDQSFPASPSSDPILFILCRAYGLAARGIDDKQLIRPFSSKTLKDMRKHLGLVLSLVCKCIDMADKSLFVNGPHQTTVLHTIAADGTPYLAEKVLRRNPALLTQPDQTKCKPVDQAVLHLNLPMVRYLVCRGAGRSAYYTNVVEPILSANPHISPRGLSGRCLDEIKKIMGGIRAYRAKHQAQLGLLMNRDPVMNKLALLKRLQGVLAHREGVFNGLLHGEVHLLNTQGTVFEEMFIPDGLGVKFKRVFRLAWDAHDLQEHNVLSKQ